MANITQTISPLPTLATPPNPNTPSTFDALAYPYTVSQNAFGVALGTFRTELTIFATQVNEVKDEINTARNQVINAVSFISEVTLVDATPTDGSTNPVSSNGVFDALALKAPLASPTFTGTVVLPSTTSIGTITNTELSYIDGVTSPIQAQLNGKATTNATDTVAGGVKVRLNGTVAYFTNNGNNA